MSKINYDKTGKGSGVNSRPLVYKDNLMFGNMQGIFFCFDKYTGKERWRIETGEPIVGRAVKSNDYIYFGSNNGYLYKIDPKGNIKWKFKTGGGIMGVSVYKEKIIFGSTDKNLYILNKNGQELSKYKTGGKIFTKPKIFEDKIFFGSCDSHFYCINFNGNLIWRFYAGDEISSVMGDMDIKDSKIYFASVNKYVYCLSLNGELLWKTRTGDDIFTCPKVYKDKLFVNARDGNFYCFDKNNGKINWIFKFYTTAYSTPVIENGVIYFGSCYPRNKFFALDTSGNKLWDFIANESIGPPAVDKNKIYFCCWNGVNYCLDKNGKEIWRVVLGTGEMADLSFALPKPNTHPESWESISKQKTKEKRRKKEIQDYEKGTQIIFDDIDKNEYVSETTQYRGLDDSVGSYKKGSSAYSDLRKKQKERKREEFFLRRQGRM